MDLTTARAIADPTVGPVTPSLRGRVVLITGGASELGTAIAHVLGEAGARVVLADGVLSRAQDRAAALGERDIDALAVELDVRDAEQCARAVALTVEFFDRLDVLINNAAAVDVTASLAELPLQDWQRLLATNLFGPLVMARCAVAQLTRQGSGGNIINITLTNSQRVWPHASAHHAINWGLLGLSHALHADLIEQNISVCAVVVGGLRALFVLDRFPDIDKSCLQDALSVATMIRFILQQPYGSVIPELTVLPRRERSWP